MQIDRSSLAPTSVPATSNAVLKVPLEVPLEVQSIVVGYPAQQDACLHDVSFCARQGEVTAVIGPNGAGKTTLVRAVTGLVPLRSGSVLLFGEELGGYSRTRLAQRVAVVAQSSRVALGFSVREVVAMGRAPYQGSMLVGTKQDQDIVQDALAETELLGLADRPVASLSGGEQKRVAIARAFAQQPDLLILDEAAAHLDIRYQVALRNLVLDRVKHQGLTCLSIMHDLTDVVQWADHVVILRQGRLYAKGPVHEVMRSNVLEGAFGVELVEGVVPGEKSRFFIARRDLTGPSGARQASRTPAGHQGP